MGSDKTPSSFERRSFLSRLGLGATAFTAAFAATSSPAEAQSPAVPAQGWQPTRHAEDDWFDQVTAKHRVFFDTTTADGFGLGLRFASNTLSANRSGYGLSDSDVALIISVRHQSTPFAYADAMWKKYGGALAERSNFRDPKTKEPPTINVFQAAGYGEPLLNMGILIDSLTKRGARLSVCGLSTRAAASLIARQTGATADAIFKELSENLVPSARIVPAGIVAVNRAQERGYSLAYTG